MGVRDGGDDVSVLYLFLEDVLMVSVSPWFGGRLGGGLALQTVDR